MGKFDVKELEPESEVLLSSTVEKHRRHSRRLPSLVVLCIVLALSLLSLIAVIWLEHLTPESSDMYRTSRNPMHVFDICLV